MLLEVVVRFLNCTFQSIPINMNWKIKYKNKLQYLQNIRFTILVYYWETLILTTTTKPFVFGFSADLSTVSGKGLQRPKTSF